MRSVLRRVACAVVATGSLAVTAHAAMAAQVTIVDVTYEHSATTTKDSHYYPRILPETPKNWVAPVDYTQGSAYVYLEVFTKPSQEGTKYQVCFEGKPSYACTDQAPTYTSPGQIGWATRMTAFYQFSMVDWTMGVARVALILKDTMNGKPAPENVGDARSALFMPTRLRVAVTLVSAGSTYVPPAPTPDGGVASDAGGARDAVGLSDTAAAGSDAASIVSDATVAAVDQATPVTTPDAATNSSMSTTQQAKDGGCAVSGGSPRDDRRAPGLAGIVVWLFAAMVARVRRRRR